MNTAFRLKLQSAGIDFTRFLIGVCGALASVKNPKYAEIIEQGASVLDAHLSTLQNNDDVPAEATAVATADPNGGFPGAPRPGSPAVAVNGHIDDTTAPENKKGYEEPDALKEAPAPAPVVAAVAAISETVVPKTAIASEDAGIPLANRVAALEANIGAILAILQAKTTDQKSADSAAGI